MLATGSYGSQRRAVHVVGLEGRVDGLEQALGRGARDGVRVPVVDRLGVAGRLTHDVAVDAVVRARNALLRHDVQRLADPPVEVVRIGLRGGLGGLGDATGGLRGRLGGSGRLGRLLLRGGRLGRRHLQLQARVDQLRVVADGGAVVRVELLPAARDVVLVRDAVKSVALGHGVRERLGLGRLGHGLCDGGCALRRLGGARVGGSEEREGECRSAGAGDGDTSGERIGSGATVLASFGHGGIPLRRLRGELSGSGREVPGRARRCTAVRGFTPSRAAVRTGDLPGSPAPALRE